MNKYQLLRSNKESGPYTIEDLKKLGLKPFDLIWVDGKSFSWRYPSEIDELKEIAPPMELPLSATPSPVSVSAAAPTQPAPLDSLSTSHVYATMPRENDSHHPTIQVPPAEPPIKDPAPRIIVEEEQLPVGGFEPNDFSAMETPPESPKEEKKAEINELYIVHSQRKNDEVKQDDMPRHKDQPIEPRRQEPVQSDRKFSDRFRAVEEKRLEIKEMFPAKPKRKRDLTDTLMLGFVAVALLMTGYLIGAYYSGKKEKAQAQDAAASAPVQEESSPAPSESAANPDTALSNAAPIPAKPKPLVKQPKKEKKAEEAAAAVAEQQARKDNAAAEEQKQKEAADKEQAKIAARANIYQDVRIKANDYKKVFLGGISDLKITVNNGSKYVLDEVVVEVSYLKNNKDVFKTEALHFQNLLPGAEATVVAPDSKRGTKVDYRVLSVKSKDLGM